MKNNTAKIRFGTCSWKYDSWQGIVYSPNAKNNYLNEYSKKYNTVEIDQWFWSLFGVDKIALPLPNVVKEYSNSVPDDFKFTVKIPNSISLTHFYRKHKTEPLTENPFFLSNDLFDRFLNSLETMRPKLGMLMFQFEYLNMQKMPSMMAFIDKVTNFISKCDRELNYGIEIRNPNYLKQRYFKFLNEEQIGHVFCHGYYMPPSNEIYDRYKEYLQNTMVIRLHGPDRSDIEEKSKGLWNKIIEPKDDEISRITRVIENIHSRNLDLYVNANNHYEGSAPLTLQRIQERLSEE
jgi:uncharacterized protein YecE (DUF72 family)